MNARITIGNATILRLLMGANVNITGQNGLTPYIGSNGNWWIGITDTGFKVVGNDGLTPYIKNGNWWIGEIDTGVAADAQPWTPIFSLAMDGSRYVQKLTSYVGGSGAAPTANIGQYLKSDGTFTSVITEAATYTNAEALSSKVDKGGSDKTLKQVEDEIVQLAGEVSIIKENVSSLSIACFYLSMADLQADDSPINQNTGEPLLIGELAAVSNDNIDDLDNGKIYAWTGSGWKYMGKIDAITSMDFTNIFFDTI